MGPMNQVKRYMQMTAHVLSVSLSLIACESPPTMVSTPPQPEQQVVGFNALCLVHGNEDSVLDILGVEQGTIGTLMMLNGKNGDVMWKGGAFLEEFSLHCFSPELFFVHRGNLQVNISSTKTPGKAIPFAVAGVLQEYGEGENCVAFGNAQGQLTAVDLQSKRASKCDVESMRQVSQQRSSVLVNRETTAVYENGANQYQLSVDQEDKLVVTLLNDKTQIWQRKLPHKLPKLGSEIVVEEGVVVVLGSKSNDENDLFGIDAQTGQQKYEIPYQGRVGMLAYNGMYLIGEWANAVHAFTIADGKNIWKVGE